jgi:predicted HicB family RNase H-like nuclease
MLEYKGYYANVKYSKEDKLFIGHVAGMKDYISFQGETVSEISDSFRNAVNDYLAFCEKVGKEPEKGEFEDGNV